MNWLKPLLPFIKHVLHRPYQRINYFMQHPGDVQEKQFFGLLSNAKNTEWGKKYHYHQIRNIEQYRQQVPVSAYEDLNPYIMRMMQGEQNVLWASPIRWFSKSSGTTNDRSKFIPVSPESLQTCHFRGGRDMMALYIENKPQTRFALGKSLAIGGTYQEHPEYKGTYFGDVSAVMTQQLPFWAQKLRAPSLEVAMLSKWEEKIERMAKETLSENITSLLGVPTWMIMVLQRVLEITGKNHILEVWENLEAFFHGAVSFQPYKELFGQLAPGISFMEVYNASEGFFGLQDDFSRDDMLLMLDYGVFYEFVEMEDWENPFPKTRTIEEVELHKNYAMLISTNAGLWRYKIGDTIKFTSKNPYRIKITGRTKHFINAFGEELMVENADVAIAKACQATNATIIDFTACPIYIGNDNKGGHEWLIEFEQEPNNLTLFTEVLDKTLRAVNSDYDAKRYQDIALQKPFVQSVPKDTFHNWLKIKGKLGGQHKVPRLANTRQYVDEILAINLLQK
ncbi:MAG: GH3 auxin-responsive promoter family protein [Thermonemataceae bacterium]|nr:GH3 auxin-responsive promoter family protein [Thermonemataceae bacterium]